MKFLFFTLFFIILNFLTHEIKTLNYVINYNNLKNNYFCIYKNIDEGETIDLNYIISGRFHLDTCNAYLYDPQEKIIYEKYNDKKGKLENYNIKISGKYKFCLKPLSTARINVNIDFHTKSEIGDIKDLAQDRKYFI
jgi:hypothetical protein